MIWILIVWVPSQMTKNTHRVLMIVPEDAMSGDQDVLDSLGKDRRMANQLFVTWNINILFPLLTKPKERSLIKISYKSFKGLGMNDTVTYSL